MATVLMVQPSSELYGSDRMFAESVSGTIKAGHDVIAVLPQDGPLVNVLHDAGARVETIDQPIVRKDNLSVTGLASLAGQTAADLMPMIKLIRDTHCDVVYVSTVITPMWLVLSRALGKRVVAHVHEAERRGPKLVRQGLYAQLICAHEIIANSQFAAAQIAELYPTIGERTVVVYNGVQGPDRSINQVRSTLTGDIRLVYVGRLSERKGVDLIIDAVAELIRDGLSITLDVVGQVADGYEWFYTKLREKISAYGIDDVVTMHGFTHDVWSHLEQADIALVPSQVEEPFGNAAVETVLAGRPVVYTECGGLPEAVGEFDTAIGIEPGGAQSIADGIRHVVAQWPNLATRTEANATRARKKFGCQRYEKEISNVIVRTH